VRRFESQFPGLHILKLAQLMTPPHGPEICIMWVEEAFSLRSASKRSPGEVNRVAPSGPCRVRSHNL
jgi:hypothetical protein